VRVLIVKLSSLGDIVHTMPVVADIRAAHPGAVIDWVVEPAFAPLVRRIDGIGEVIEAPLRRWRERWWSGQVRREWSAFKLRMQRDAYDAVIDLQGLTKSVFVARLAPGRRYGIANRTEGSSHELLARWLVDQAIALPPRIHALDRGRLLVSKVLGTRIDSPPRFGLQARPQPPQRYRTMVFVHGTSRLDKLWPEARWATLGRRFVETGWHIGLPHGDEMEQVRAERLAAAIHSQAVAFDSGVLAGGPLIEVWPRMRLDALIDRLGSTQGVIGVDSGPSHIAVALGLPHVQLYLHPTAWRTGPRPEHGHSHQLSIGGETAPTLDAVWAAWQRVATRARGA
jgi:heptosyltransferase-1